MTDLPKWKKNGSSNFLYWLLAQSELIVYLTFSVLKRQQYARSWLSLHRIPGERAIQTEVVTAFAQCGHIFCFYFFSWMMHLLTWANVWSRPLQHYAFRGCHSPHWSALSDCLRQGFSTLGLLFWTNSLGGGYHLGIGESSAAALVSTHLVLLAPSPCLTTKMSPGGKWPQWRVTNPESYFQRDSFEIDYTLPRKDRFLHVGVPAPN